MLPAATSPNGLDEMFGVASLQHVAPGARSNRFDHELAVVVGGEHDDPDERPALLDLAGRLQSVHLRHADVEQHDVGFDPAGLEELDHLVAVRRLAQDLDVAGHLQIAAQALAHQGVIVSDDYFDPHVLHHRRRHPPT